ncbi:MAG: MiaB/RimO family radical SAM methylthiotransferase, partial [Bacteroidales bacterium]|nr:MiaB/RimO family radical SAM methylthiotransferase [Bacteroidales bacterium]
RKLTTPSHYAYLKISEGCDRKCTFCAIPLIRGRQVSRSIEELKQEAKKLTASGVKELILIAQDLTAYGTDLYGKQELARLLDALVDIPGLSWIRLHYTYPAAFPEDVIDRIREYSRICNYLDIPFQHISDQVLKNMHRGINSMETLELIAKMRTVIPGVAIRTTLMTGHPGEGAEEFQQLIDFIKSARFERLGAFVYSEEEGTWGAQNLKDSIPEPEKLARFEEIMQIQQSISLEINQSRVGQIMKVLIDRQEGDYYIGRTEYDSPEVDNEVLIQSKSPLAIGDFSNVHITEAGEFDLSGFAV